MPAAPDVRSYLSQIRRLRESCLDLEASHAHRVEGAENGRPSLEDRVASSRNLLHYLAIRREDLRPLHTPLAEMGLSSLGRIEPHVLENLNGVIQHLERTCGADASRSVPVPPISLTQAGELIERRTAALLGPARTGSSVRIMVTLPNEAACNAGLVGTLIDAGMSCARINTAHDSPSEWVRMCRNIRSESARRASRGEGECRILMDLAGPKLRTGPIVPGPEVIRVKPVRDATGRVTRDATVVLRPEDSTSEGLNEIPIERTWLERLEAGDAIELFDTRGRRRVLYIEGTECETGDLRVTAGSDRTIYFGSGVPLRLLKPRDRQRECRVGRLPALLQAIVVRPGEHVRLALNERMGRPASGSDAPAVLTCTLPEAFARAKVGETVWLDDGRVGAVIDAVAADSIDLRITVASARGDRILEDKGVNLPDTDIVVHGITKQDAVVLPIAAEHADMVGMSFVREASDVIELRDRLDRLGGAHVGTILKIETRRAFNNLPHLLLAALRGPSAGVMIARGDLAVEVGYDRLAEVQEEILWLCEAAHLPVIWATQVLETMAKTGRPSRAEVTDAAMGERAECVMLNKGPHIVEAVRFLANLMGRMQEHQSKKRTILRALNVAKRFALSATRSAAGSAALAGSGHDPALGS
jgi:pyruvate kinase